MSEYRCVECETPHDNQEDANLCCACPNCGNLQTQLNELQAENERLKEGMEWLADDWTQDIILEAGHEITNCILANCAKSLDSLRRNT